MPGPVADARLSAGTTRSRTQARDRAVSTVVGTLLMALLTVTMALALSDFVRESMPEPGSEDRWDFGASLVPGESRWGDGDEQVRVLHRGGPALHAEHTRIRIEVGGDASTYEGASLGSAFDDGTFTIGERWRKNLTVHPGENVAVRIILTEPRSRVISDAQLKAGVGDCDDDKAPPYLEALSQDPSDLDSGHAGAVTVTATLQDACVGVDANATPHLEYRVGNGSTFQDAGAMTKISTTSWRGEIPEPTDGWASHENKTLTYHLDPIEDLANNTGTSENTTDHIQPGQPAAGTLTYATDHVAFSGTVDGFTNLQNASDQGAAANLTENATGTGPVTSEIYGTAHSSSGATAPGNATGAPDDGHATLPSEKDWIGVTGFNTFQGAIQTVEIAFEGHANGTANGGEDELELAYEISGTPGATTRTYNLTELGTTDGNPRYVNVTGDRAWTWTDVSNLLVKGTYNKQQAEDAADLHIDALWTRVTYEDPGWNLSVEMNVTSLPSASTHELELRYNTTGEAFHVQVFNASDAAWHERGPALTATNRTNWSIALDDAEVTNGTVDLRLIDDAADASQQDRLSLDYARVRSR